MPLKRLTGRRLEEGPSQEFKRNHKIAKALGLCRFVKNAKVFSNMAFSNAGSMGATLRPLRNSDNRCATGPIGRLLQRGVGLIEATLFVVISLGLVVGGTVFFQQTSEAARVNDAVQSIVSIQSGVRSLYVAEANFGAAGSDLAEAVITSGSVTPNMVLPDGSIEHQWGGAVSITGYPKTFVVDYQEVPRSACVRLAPYSAAGTGAAGNGIASIAINGVLVDEDGDGMVSPTEAEQACVPTVTAADPVRMKWAFLADSNMRTSAWEVEGALGIEPGETSRDTEAESRQCGAGFLGNETRSRDHVTLQDGSTSTTDWSQWDRAGCVAIVETSRRTENQAGTCPPGMVGASARNREIISMSDGSEQIGDWSEWDLSACQIVEVSRRAETENGTCPTGTVGTATRTREVIVMSDDSEQPQAWSGWDISQCLVVEVSQRTETETVACGAGYTGNQTRTRTVLVMSNGSEQPQSWSGWNTAACQVSNVIVETRTYRSQEFISCANSGLAVRSWNETKDRWTNGSITSRGRVHAGDGSCVAGNGKGYSYIDVRIYANCGAFGQQSFYTQQWRGAHGTPWHHYTNTSSGGCGYY